MSNFSKTGTPRHMMAVAFAVLAVAMMLAAPVLTSVSSDADFKIDQAGYAITMNDPTDAEIDKYATGSRAANIDDASYEFLFLFNLGIFEDPVATCSSYKYVEGGGEDYQSRVADASYVYEVTADSVKMTYTANKTGALIDDYAVEDDASEKAAKAIKDYLGNEIDVGDKLTITGKVSSQTAYYETMEYASVDSTHSVLTKVIETVYHIYDIDVTIGLLKAGAGTGNTIEFKSNLKFMGYYDMTYDYYGVKYSDLKEGDPCKLTYGAQHSSFVQGSSHYTIADKDYPLPVVLNDGYSEETVTTITNDSEVNTNLLNDFIKTLPDSSGNVTVGKTYGDAEALYNNIVMQVAVQEIIDMFLILAAIVAVIFIVIMIFVIILIRKRSK